MQDTALTEAGFSEQFARDILDNSDIGITEFTREMFLFKEDWSPENIFGPPPLDDADAEPEQLRDGPDLFDDDLDSWRQSTTAS